MSVRRPRAVRPSAAGEPILTARSYSTLLAADVVAFGGPDRDEGIQHRLRERLYAHLAHALAITWLSVDDCHVEDRGDGVLVVPSADIPAHLLLDPLAHHLGAVLRRGNRLLAPAARMRLRLAVHMGPVFRDRYGVSGHAVVHLFRMLDCEAVRAGIDLSDSDLAMIVSERLFQDVVRNNGYVDRSRYRPVAVKCKETTDQGWLWLSDAPGQEA
ncbi:hypothetical protein [Spirillospora albida]|uniref:hypothetical protein n=1 Tax=Spirillospora albida TaxID=58123 RepID=UPI0012FCD900|nr:hypothetical protein [Spirillospora albida]